MTLEKQAGIPGEKKEETFMGRFCAQCGKELAAENAFCPECGAPVPAAPAPEPQPIPAVEAEPVPAPVLAEEPLSAPVEEPMPVETVVTEAPAAESVPVAEPVPVPVQEAPAPVAPPVAPPPPPPAAPAKPEKEPIPRGGKFGVLRTIAFMGLMLLFAVPLVGFIAGIIMTFAPKNRNIRSFARANVIFQAIAIVLCIAIAIGLFGILGAAAGTAFSAVGSLLSLPSMMEEILPVLSLVTQNGDDIGDILDMLESGDMEGLMDRMENGEFDGLFDQMGESGNITIIYPDGSAQTAPEISWDDSGDSWEDSGAATEEAPMDTPVENYG